MKLITKIDDITIFSSYFMYIDSISKEVYVLNSNHNFDKRFYEWVNLVQCNSGTDKSRSLLDAFKKLFNKPCFIYECKTLEEWKKELSKILGDEEYADSLCR